MLDLGGGVGLQDLGGHPVGVLLGGADLHEADTGVVDEQVAELPLLVFVVSDGRDAGQAERVFLLTAVGDGVRLLVEGDGGEFVFGEEPRPQDQVREQAEQVALLGQDDIQDEGHDAEDAEADAEPLDQLRA